ncbi:BlaI/MecI/CopY family transcriptional regulator [Paenibacillus sp. 1P07SE]|uniref:BlaI/MecI/CopY family transcriptional regulator n=1 Tax=Paenibacillus sp. 1P07SE TaxID=3132209 RepID=UPI0039A55840
MSDTPRISEAEWEVMKVLWTHAPATAKEVIDRLEDQTAWSPKTIRTLLSRLVQKEVLTYRQEGKTYLYSPLLSEEQCRRAEGKSFLRKVYGGALAPMLTHFLAEQKLSRQEIDELKSLLDEKREDQR